MHICQQEALRNQKKSSLQIISEFLKHLDEVCHLELNLHADMQKNMRKLDKL